LVLLRRINMLHPVEKRELEEKRKEKTPSPPGKPTNLPNPAQTKEKG